MEHPFKRVMQLIEACGGSIAFPCDCCPRFGIEEKHVLGPKHFQTVKSMIPNNGLPLDTDKFWQTFAFKDGAVAFNHVDGSIRMTRRDPDGP